MTGLLSVAGSTASDEGFELKSCRFDDTAGKKLTRTPSSDGNKKTWTISFWMKPAVVSTAQTVIFDGGGVSTTETPLMVVDDQWIEFNMWDSATSSQLFKIKTNQEFRDPSAWYHIVLTYDSPQPTAADRIKLYVNGSQVTSLSTANYPSQNLEASVNDNYEHYIGSGAQPNDWSGYLAQFYLIDGSALTPSSFGETNALTNQWQPINPTNIKPTLTFGTNGFYLPFSNDALDDSFTDSSSGAHTITVAGDTKNTRVSNHKVTPNGNAHIIGPKIGSSAIAFDGDGDYLSIPSSSDFGFGAGDFTLELWFYRTASDTYPYILDGRTTGTDGSYPTIYFDSTDSYKPVYYVSGAAKITSSASTNTDTWYNIAVVRSSGTTTMYLDGSSVGTWSDSTTYATCPIIIGDYSTFGTYEWTGYMDEIRISDDARYTANFTPTTTAFTSDANTMLLIHSNTTMGSTTFTDSSSNAHTVTANGDVMNVAPKIGVGMGAFDGTGDELEIPNSAGFNYGTEDFTVEMWVSFGDVTINNQQLMFKRNVTYYGDYILWWSTTNGLVFTSGTGGSGTDLSQGSTSGWANDTWYHIALVRSGTALKVYKDGTSILSATNSIDFSNTGNLFIASSDGSGYFTGRLDEIRISRTARYTSNFSTTTTAFKDDKDTVLLTHMDGGGGINPATNLPTLPGQGTYFWDASVNAIFYGADGIPTYKSYMAFDGSGDYLSMPASSDWDITGDYTWECWVNPNKNPAAATAVHMQMMGQYLSSTDRNQFFLGDGGGVNMWLADGGSSDWYGNTGYQFEAGVWHHVAASRASGTLRVYIDGTELFNASSSLDTNFSAPFLIARKDGTMPFDGKMDQVRISDTARYTSNFTAPTTPFTTDVNTKLLIQSDYSEGGLGADHSGNYNYWTPTNLTVNDMMLDSPMNNFCTMNSIVADKQQGGSVTFREGNLEIETNHVSGNYQAYPVAYSTMAQDSGKWYAEFLMLKASGASTIEGGPGVMGVDNMPYLHSTTPYIGRTGGSGCGYMRRGELRGFGQDTGGYGTFDENDIISIAMDLDNLKCYWAKNNVWITIGGNVGVPTSGAAGTGAISMDAIATSGPYAFACADDNATDSRQRANFGQDSSFAGEKTSQGNQDENDKGDFYYSVPAGFLALCTDNLPDPSIELPGENFNTVLYDDGAGAKTGIGFQPDLVWVKSRGAVKDNKWTDAIRGVTKAIVSNDPQPETTDSTGLTAFGADGFTVGADTDYSDTTGTGMVAWNWKGDGVSGGTANTDGTTNSQVNANPTAGFSIVTYTGTGSVATVGHGLSQAPEIIIFKKYSSGVLDQWRLFSENVGNTKAISFSENDSFSASATWWNDTSPTASVFTLGTGAGVNHSGYSFVAYCFHSVEGYSKIGLYTGNGIANGPFTYTGFTPGWALVKSTTRTEHWDVVDIKRGNNLFLSPNLDQSARGMDGGTGQDLHSNGWKIRTTDNNLNYDDEVYLYMTFAESPFKTSNAR